MSTVDAFDPILTEPQASTRVYLAIIDHFSGLIGEKEVSALVDEIGLDMTYLLKPEQWVSLAFGDRFCRSLAHRASGRSFLAHDDPIWEEWRAAGRRSVSQEIFGPLWALARALGSPAAFFRAFPLISAQANRCTRFHLMEPWLPPDLQVLHTDAVTIKGRASAVRVLHLGLAPQAEH